jgi:CheY-like chemotaxis protein
VTGALPEPQVLLKRSDARYRVRFQQVGGDPIASLPILAYLFASDEEITATRMLTRNLMRIRADSLHPFGGGPPEFAVSRSAEKATESISPSLISGSGTSSPKSILVVDDERALRELVADAVTRLGFRAHMARDGEEGWEALCITTYDLLITDHEMPRLTGLALIKRLRTVSMKPPCILTSGSLPMPESLLKKIVHPGAVLPKPFSVTKLIEKVHGLLMYGDSRAPSQA